MVNFNKSQNAHRRLAKKYSNSKNDYDWVKRTYHSCCVQEQKKKGRVLTEKEKKELYRNTEFYFFN